MKKLIFILAVLFTFTSFAQQPCNSCPITVTVSNASGTTPIPQRKSGVKSKTTKKTYITSKKPATTVYRYAPKYEAPVKKVEYQDVDPNATQTTTPTQNAENIFPLVGNAGVGTLEPMAALELKRNAGDGKNKNFLLQLSNIWSPKGLNEPTIVFSNGDLNPTNTSYWTVGAKVSGNEIDKDPVAFKIGFKAPNEADEHEFFSIDSYKGRVKIGYCNANVDGYKLYVEEGILTEKVKVAVKDSEDWYDHVFNADYQLMPLTDLEKYIGDNKHLPDMPTTKEVMSSGLDLGKTQGLLLKKVEELTLYLIELKKDLDQTKKELAAFKK